MLSTLSKLSAPNCLLALRFKREGRSERTTKLLLSQTISCN
ncbi:hypothetical protein HMPREF1586_01254 [Gardnerella vaginalis JCP8522]|nr:hypothetical protein HMPREF1586_01254 [Gardnerella vaginalis JCP8522]